nr:TetR/AcrR family transcriptional regulator [Streptomyces sp. Xyl84]
MQRERSRRTREFVLDTAAEEFSRNGYAVTTLNAVAARTGMTKGAVYGHFASKTELANALVECGADAWDVVLRTSTGPDRDPLAALRSLTLGLTRALHEQVRLKAALRLVADAPEGAEPVKPHFVQDIRRHMAALVREAQDQGALTPRYAAQDVAELLLVVVFGTQSPALAPQERELLLWMNTVWHILEEALRA